MIPLWKLLYVFMVGCCSQACYHLSSAWWINVLAGCSRYPHFQVWVFSIKVDRKLHTQEQSNIWMKVSLGGAAQSGWLPWLHLYERNRNGLTGQHLSPPHPLPTLRGFLFLHLLLSICIQLWPLLFPGRCKWNGALRPRWRSRLLSCFSVARRCGCLLSAGALLHSFSNLKALPP